MILVASMLAELVEDARSWHFVGGGAPRSLCYSLAAATKLCGKSLSAAAERLRAARLDIRSTQVLLRSGAALEPPLGAPLGAPLGRGRR